VAELDHHKF